MIKDVCVSGHATAFMLVLGTRVYILHDLLKAENKICEVVLFLLVLSVRKMTAKSLTLEKLCRGIGYHSLCFNSSKRTKGMISH